MRNIFIYISVLLFWHATFAQETEAFIGEQHNATGRGTVNEAALHYKFGVGGQYTYPFYSLSLQYVYDINNVAEALFSPASSNEYGLSFYGARYVYRFDFNYWSGIHARRFPYFLAGAGVLGWNYNNEHEIHFYGNTVGFFAGGGYEVIYGNHFGISAEFSYGLMGTSNNQAAFVFSAGAGCHYYFFQPKTKKPKPDTDPESTPLMKIEDGIPHE